MKNAVILHGTFNTPQDNWFPWLSKQLEQKGYQVWVPLLPGAESPSIPRYNKFLFANWTFDKDTVLIGHSSGAVAILGILQELPKDVVIDKAILVSVFINDLDWDPTRELFATYSFDYKKIKNKAKEFIIIHSDNDEFISLDQPKVVQKELGGKLVVLPGQSHFSVESMGDAYKKFSEILKYV